jgi:hypothetical protein
VVEYGQKDNRVAWRDIVDVLKDWKKMLIIVFNVTSVLVSVLLLTLFSVCGVVSD